MEPARDMILEVGRLATLGVDQRLDRGGPAPAGLKDAPAERDTAQRHEFEESPVELPRLIRASEVLFLHRCHDDDLPCMVSSEVPVSRRTTAFTGGAACKDKVARKTIMAARSSATSWFGRQ